MSWISCSIIAVFICFSFILNIGQSLISRDVNNRDLVLSQWMLNVANLGDYMTYQQVSQYEREVVDNVNKGLWPESAYHAYQTFVSTRGNVDSAKLMLEYGITSSISHESENSVEFRRVISKLSGCNTKSVVDDIIEVSESTDNIFLLRHGVSLLLAATFAGCFDVVKHLIIEHDIDIEGTGSHGMNVLMVASSLGHSNIVKLLIDVGKAKPSSRHKFVGTTPLHMASEMNHYETIKVLCDLGADPKAETVLGGTPLHTAAEVNSILAIESLIKECKLSPNILMKEDTTALYLAAQHGHKNAVSVLLELGADVSYSMPTNAFHDYTALMTQAAAVGSLAILNSQPGNGAQAIHAAAENGHLSVIKVLLRYNADIESRTIGVTPLHLAVQYNHADIVSYLLRKGAVVDSISAIDGSTPLYHAVGHGSLEIATMLLQANASPIRTRLIASGFPLLYAAIRENIDMLQLLIDHTMKISENNVTKFLAFINFSDPKDGITSLHAAASVGNIKSVSLLLSHRANVLTRSVDVETPLHAAVLSGNTKVVESIISHVNLMVKMNAVDTVNTLSKRTYLHTSLWSTGMTCLHQMASCVSLPTHKCLSIMKILVREDVDVNITVPNGPLQGATPLYLASSQGHMDIVNYLLSQRADPNIPLDFTIGGFTPLLSAIDRGHSKVVQALLLLDSSTVSRYYMQADPNMGSAQGQGFSQSPLLFAVIKGKSKIVKYLLDSGANCNVMIQTGKKSNSKDTPGTSTSNDAVNQVMTNISLLDLARERRWYDMVQTLSHHPQCLDIQ